MASDVVMWIAVIFRFLHVLAAIMWIGNSLLFTWMEYNLLPPEKEDDDDLLGTLDMLHAGGVYHLQKRKLKPGAIPDPLHWFMWESYTTWICGFVLITTLYHTGGGTFFLDATKSDLSGGRAVLCSLAGLMGGWIVYDQIWRSPLGRKPWIAAPLCLVLLIAAAACFNTFFNGRAVFLQIGAMMGTMMSANVFFHIIPNQRKFMHALENGLPHNLELGKAAKARSLHNHHLTFPVLFLMLSAHFPQLTSAEWNVPILAVIVVSLMFIKFLMNARYRFAEWRYAMGGTLIFAFSAIGLCLAVPVITSPLGKDMAVASGRALFLSQGCGACHQTGSSELAPQLAGIYRRPQTLTDGTEVVADDAYLRESILRPQARIVKGYAPVMPSTYGTALTSEQVDQLVAYVRSLSRKK
jgi:uncharacterized membrane protein